MGLIDRAKEAYQKLEDSRRQENLRLELERKAQAESILRRCFERTFGISGYDAKIVWHTSWNKEEYYAPFLSYEGMLFCQDNKIQLVYKYKGVVCHSPSIDGIADLGRMIHAWEEASDRDDVDYLLAKEARDNETR